MARDAESKLMAVLPEQYRGDFLGCLDATTEIGRAVQERYEALLSDLGGEANMTTIRRSLVRDFTVLDVLIEGMFCAVPARQSIDSGSLTQLMNTKLGIARILGLAPRVQDFGLGDRPISRVGDHLKGSPAEP